MLSLKAIMIQRIKNHVLSRFFREYVRKHLKIIILDVFLMGGEAIAAALTAYLAQPMVDKIFVNKDQKQLYIICIFVLAVFLLKATCEYWKQVVLTLIETKIICDLQKKLFRSVIKSDMSHFDRGSIGTTLNHFVVDIFNVRQAIGTIMVNFGRDFLMILLLISVMFYHSYKMAIFCFIGLPLIFIPFSKISQKLKRFASLTKVENDTLTSHINDTFTGIRVIKAYSGENGEIKVFDRIAESIARFSFKAMQKGAMGSPMMEIFAAVAIVISLFYGGFQVINGDMTTGAFFSFLAALVMLQQPGKGLSNTGYILHNAIVALKKIYSVINRENTIETTTNDQKSPSLLDAVIDFKNVGFSYFSERTNNSIVIRDFNLRIDKGTKIAIVGPSGGGKSTVVNLLLRFYDAFEGLVEINGHSVTDIRISHLRRNVAYVGQESFIFEDTIRNNILYGIRDITKDQLDYAIKEAGADFIYKMPFGLDTIIKQHGALSGGQKQLISVVRAMLKNAPILILDEATSSLDNNTEKEVKAALEKLSKGKTTIIIAHRLSTIIDCDTINVINEGKIVESGTHKELLDKKQLYYQLWSAQGI